MKSLGLAVVLLLLVASCADPFPGYSKVDTGLYYKIHRFTDDTLKPHPGDMVKFVMRIDELNVEDENKTYLIPFDPEAEGFQADLSRFHVGDSIGLIFSSERMREEFGIRLPIGEKHHHVQMAMLDVIRKEEWERNRAAERRMQNDLQEVAIDTYLASTDREFVERKGMLLSEDPRPTARKVPSGKPLYLYYVSRTLDGRTIELNIEQEAYIDYTIGMQGQVIEGLERIIPTLYLNETAELIVPFDLAFGEKGVPGVVAPYTPLRYTIIVRDSPAGEEVVWK